MLNIVQLDIDGLGHCYAPKGPGPFPALLLLHGSEGSRGWLAHRDAAIFAAHGFLAYPHPYSLGDTPWIGGDIWQVNLDGAEQALAALRATHLCAGKVGVYGWSRGAEHAILATALLAACDSSALPDAVAAHAAPDKVMGAWRNLFARKAETSLVSSADWTFQHALYDPALPAWTWRSRPIPPGAPVDIEAYAGPLFLSVGDQDEVWPAEMTARLAERLRQAGRAPEVHVYEGQLHMPDPACWNRHLSLVLDFFGRHLSA